MSEFDLDIKHSSYQRSLRVFDDSRGFYEGSEVIGYLRQGNYEKKKYFERRKEAFVYENLLKPIIHARVGLLTRKPMGLTLPKVLDSIVSDVDGMGNNLSSFFKSVAIDADVDGLTWVLVDFPNTASLVDEGGNPLIRSRQDEESLRLRPFFRSLSRKQVINWHLNSQTQQLEWVVIKQMVSEAAVIGKEVKSKETWTLWQPHSISVYSKNKECQFVLESKSKNTLGVIPLVPFFSVKSHQPYEAMPFGSSILCHLKRILNIESLIDAGLEPIIQPRLFVVGTEQPSEVPTSDNAFFLSYGDVGEKPEAFYIEPSGKGIELGKARVHDLIYRVYKTTLHLHRKESAQVQSEKSQLQENTTLKGDLSSTALNHENSLKALLSYAYQWLTSQQASEGEISVNLNRDFDTRRFEPQEIESLGKLYDRGALSLNTLWEALIQGEVLPQRFDAEREYAALVDQQDAFQTQLNFNHGVTNV